jgi:Flp pilus assembly pilin Flp
MQKLSNLIRGAGGGDLAEYALLVSLIILVVIAGASLLGGRIAAIFNGIAGLI